MRRDVRKFEGPGEGRQGRGWFLSVHDSVVVQLW